MVWKKYIKTGSNHIRVNPTGLYLTKEAHKILDKKERVGVYYDIENKSICLQPKEDTYKVSVNKFNTAVIQIAIFRVMPKGRYEYTKDNIFVLSEEKK